MMFLTSFDGEIDVTKDSTTEIMFYGLGEMELLERQKHC